MDVKVKFDEPITEVHLIEIAKQIKVPLSEELEIVIKTAFKDLRNLPTLGYTSKKTNKYEDSVPLQEYLKKFIKKYTNGYEARPSKRIANSSKTFPDPVIGLLVTKRINGITPNQVSKLVLGHSLQMSMENIVGDFLEEYLAIELKAYGWCCCWGSSIDAVDFCKENGDLLQVKNSDNSENSSSSRVRNGTIIKKWARRKSTKDETFFWDKLIALTGVTTLSEDNFRKFINKSIIDNPKCINVKDESIFL